MEIARSTLSTCSTATDLVVAIDVLRAFTTAAYLFSKGVKEIILVSGVEEAFDLRKKMPECLLMGEVHGARVPGFDMGNSPSEIMGMDLSGKRAIQRTTAGTQGVVLATKASTILTAALTNVSATARYIKRLTPEKVTLIHTGAHLEEGWGDEDVACADAIENLLLGREVDWDGMSERVRCSRSADHYDGTQSDYPPEDLELALKIDCFDFAMVVERENNLHFMRSIAA
ncbi:MAG: 2-phosphosulfolactate phosphatase [Anaerolineaceae bacterium]